jgi:hypothetical protein
MEDAGVYVSVGPGWWYDDWWWYGHSAWHYPRRSLVPVPVYVYPRRPVYLVPRAISARVHERHLSAPVVGRRAHR